MHLCGKSICILHICGKSICKLRKVYTKYPHMLLKTAIYATKNICICKTVAYATMERPHIHKFSANFRICGHIVAIVDSSFSNIRICSHMQVVFDRTMKNIRINDRNCKCRLYLAKQNSRIFSAYANFLFAAYMHHIYECPKFRIMRMHMRGNSRRKKTIFSLTLSFLYA